MKRPLQICGVVCFWLAWPLWFIYFRRGGTRSRVLVVCQQEILLVKGWLSSGSWGLPGGGTLKNEKVISSAIRELYEEVGIEAIEADVRSIDTIKNTKNGLHYDAEYFMTRLSKKPTLRLRKSEISEAQWVPVTDIHAVKVDAEVIELVTKHLQR